MDFRKDLRWIVEAQNRCLPLDERYSDEELDNLVEKTQMSYEQGLVDFSKYTEFRLRQGKKKRDVKKYTEFHPESVFEPVM